VSDATSRQLEREEITDEAEFRHRLSRTHSPSDLELVCYEKGMKFDATKVVVLGADYKTSKGSPLSLGQAHLAFKQGLWVPEVCFRCLGQRGSQFSMGAPHGTPASCPVCFGLGYKWSDLHAVVGGYAGELSLRRALDREDCTEPLHDINDGCPDPACPVYTPESAPLDLWVATAGSYSALVPVAAIYGVARKWAETVTPDHPKSREINHAVMLMWSYLAKPSRAKNEAMVRVAWHGTPSSTTGSHLPRCVARSACDAFDLASRRATLEEATVELGATAVAEAARWGVRRWAFRSFEEPRPPVESPNQGGRA